LLIALPTPQLLRQLCQKVVQKLKQIGQSSRLHAKNFFGWGSWIFCEWRHKSSSAWATLAHVARPKAQLLG